MAWWSNRQGNDQSFAVSWMFRITFVLAESNAGSAFGQIPRSNFAMHTSRTRDWHLWD